MTGDQREHLFINYATEDKQFAEWLTLKLTVEGYKVWCDRLKLLGGESYPMDIDDAIKNKTFRVLGLLSKASLAKENPTKERTLALSIARERKTDFLIPINVDGLKPTELDWMTSDLTFIPFNHGWANGFSQLLKKLESLEAPKNEDVGRAKVCNWFSVLDNGIKKEERIWSNLVPILKYPKMIVRYELLPDARFDELYNQVAFYKIHPSTILTLGEIPEEFAKKLKRISSYEIDKNDKFLGISRFNVLTNLLRRNLEIFSLKKGLSFTPDGKYLYFPDKMLSENRLPFPGYKNKNTYIHVVGERTFKFRGESEKCKYHLSPSFYPVLDYFGSPMFQIGMRVYLTDLQNMPLETPKAIRRRKNICKSWWNHEWLSRLMGVLHWITEGKENCVILETPDGNLEIASKPLLLEASVGIDEEVLIRDLKAQKAQDADLEALDDEEVLDDSE